MTHKGGARPDDEAHQAPFDEPEELSAAEREDLIEAEPSQKT